jgi:hypothetical protein
MGFIRSPDREVASCRGRNRTEPALVRRSLHLAGKIHSPPAATGLYRTSSHAGLRQ